MTTPTPQSSRREFLSAKSALQALEHALPQESSHVDSHRSGLSEPQDTYLVQVGRAAMACDFDVLLNAGQHMGSTEAAIAALDLVDELETQLTVYRTTSEVVTINELAYERPIPVEPRLFSLLQRSVELNAATNGAFDITSGPLSKAWGFFRRDGQVPTEDAIGCARARVGNQWLELDSESRTIRLLRPDVEINLNAIGKGYALDRCAELLESRGVTNFLIHGGKSSVLARGSRAYGDAHGHGWVVSIKHPFRPDERVIDVCLHNRALGTSGSGNQFFHFQGKRYGHVIDPRTGWPADRVLSATVLAPTAETADALSTAMFVMGVEESIAFCEQRPELAAILVSPAPRAGEIELHTIGLTPDQMRSVEQPI